MAAFVLERFHWRRAGPGAWVRLPGENVVAAFDAGDDAHAELVRSEAEVRELVGHPFRCGTTLAEFTTFPEFAFLDWLRDADVEPPDRDPDGRTPWGVWADLYSDEWTASQLRHIWEGCNRVRFFRVRERVGEVLNCVLRVHWAQEMSYHHFLAESEGGSPVTIWHDPAAAERDRESKQELATAEMASVVDTIAEGELRFDPHRRRAAASPFAELPPAEPFDVRDAVHCEVVTVERGDTAVPLGDTAFVVVRLGWDGLFRDDGNDDSNEVPGLFEQRDGGGGVPVRVFARREDAEGWAADREGESRAAVNPFRFGGPRPPADAESPSSRSFTRDEDRMVRHLAAVGLRLPPYAPGTENDLYPRFDPPMPDWWDRHADGLIVEQRAAVWACFPHISFYTVREVRVGDGGTRPPRRVRTMYYVRATTWAPDSGPGMNPHRLLGAFADRSKAEAVRDEAERKFRESPPPEQPPPVPCEADRPWDRYSSLTEAEALRHLLDEGWPAYSVRTAHWWHESPRRPFHPRQVRAMWQVFDRVRLYEVLALPTEVAE